MDLAMSPSQRSGLGWGAGLPHPSLRQGLRVTPFPRGNPPGSTTRPPKRCDVAHPVTGAGPAAARALALALLLTVCALAMVPASALEDAPATTISQGGPWESSDLLPATSGGNAAAAGEITGLAYFFLEGGGFQVSTLFQNTGTVPLSGLTGTITITDARGRELARATLVPAGGDLLPGGEMLFTADLEAGIPPGAAFLAARVVKGDGTLLAEQEEPLEAGSTEEGTQPARGMGIPGFGAGPAVAALAIGIRRAWRNTSVS